jgi:nucleotide-binding universal stress UspA family protein
MDSRPIVVGVDISLGTARATEWAVGEAARRSCGVRLAHVLDNADTDVANRSADGLSPHMVGDALLGICRTLAERLEPRVPLETSLRHGVAADELVEESRGAQLLVVGANGVAGYARSALGSVAHRVAVRASCPVVVVSSRALTERPQLIVAGVEEGRPDTAPISAYAQAAAAATGAQLQRVDISDHAEAAEALLAAASRADLVVLGARQTKERFSTRLGGVTAGVLPLVECPVVLVAIPNDPGGL